MAIILKNAPKTEEGRKLNLSKEDEEKYRLVFRINKESKDIEICDIWNPETSYSNDCVIVPITSTYQGIKTMPVGTEVRNVLKSTKDPLYNKSLTWIQLIESVYRDKGITENARTCCLDENAYSKNDDNPTLVNHHGDADIVGGHMVEGKDTDNNIATGSSFYLLHICRSHNQKKYDNCYFKVKAATTALVMDDFLLPPKMTDTLISLSESTKTDADVEFDVKQFCEENNVELQGMSFE